MRVGWEKRRGRGFTSTTVRRVPDYRLPMLLCEAALRCEARATDYRLLFQLLHHLRERLPGRAHTLERKGRQRPRRQTEQRKEIFLGRLDVEQACQELVLLLRLSEQAEGGVLVGRAVVRAHAVQPDVRAGVERNILGRCGVVLDVDLLEVGNEPDLLNR